VYYNVSIFVRNLFRCAKPLTFDKPALALYNNLYKWFAQTCPLTVGVSPRKAYTIGAPTIGEPILDILPYLPIEIAQDSAHWLFNQIENCNSESSSSSVRAFTANLIISGENGLILLTRSLKFMNE
jgi:hypothetical protein